MADDILPEVFECINEPQKNILEEALGVVVSRGKSYGKRGAGMQKIADLWKPILGIDITPEQVALCMIQVKIGRQLHQHKRDNLVDIAGYAFVLGEVIDNG